MCAEEGEQKKKEEETGLMRNSRRAWKSTFHFRERGSLCLSAALKDPVIRVWGKEGPSWESTQVETIRGIIWAESSWWRPGGGCLVGGGPISIIAPDFCFFLTQQ